MDSFGQTSDSPEFSARRLVAIVPHDVNDLAYVTKGLLIGTGGNISVLAVDDITPVLIKVSDGQTLPIRAKRVLVTGTTATNIVGLF